jgi:glucokinase
VKAAGLDLGGTNVKVCLLDYGEAPRVVERRSAETHAERGPEAVMDVLAGLAADAIAAAGAVQAVGLGAPGPLDLERGRSLWMPNLPGWNNVPIVAEMEARLGRRVALINDSRALTLAELELGAGRGCRDLVCFALGTGVGGGVVVNGQLLLGLNGTAGELGHQTIDPEGRRCGCGNRGCLEQEASGPAIARAGGRATAEAVLEAARSGDERALAAFERAGAKLGIAIANAVLTVGPDRVVVGGGVAAAGELLLRPAREELVRRDRVQPVERVEVVAATLGSYAGAIGAALWAASRIRT